MRQPLKPQMSRSGYQSEQLRASRVTSIDRISPTSLRLTRATSSLKPRRCAVEAPLWPRSARPRQHRRRASRGRGRAASARTGAAGSPGCSPPGRAWTAGHRPPPCASGAPASPVRTSWRTSASTAATSSTTRRLVPAGSAAHRSPGSIGMLVTLLSQRDQLSHPVNAQLGASLHHLPALGRGNWDEQRAPGPVLDFVAWAHAAPARQQPDHAEVPTVERMARVDDRHLRRTGHVSFTGGDVPVGLR